MTETTQNEFLSTIFAKMLNLSAALNPIADISPLEGKSIGIDITELPSKIAMRVENGEFIACDYATTDVMISGSTTAFIGMIRDADDGLERDDLYITGKLQAAKRFQEFLSSMRLDWDKVMKKLSSGDLFEQFSNNATGIVDIATDILNASKATMQKTVEQGINAFVNNPNSPFVSRPEFEAFSQQLRDVNDRLDALLRRLADDNNNKES